MSNLASIKIAGPAGSGVKSISKGLTKLLLEQGYHCSCYFEYPSLIRGGKNTAIITLGADKNLLLKHGSPDLFIPLTQAVLEEENPKLNKNTQVNQDFINKSSRIEPQEILKLALKLKNLPQKNKDKKILISGNQAVAMGALAAGLNFYAAYPMTPASGIFNALNEVASEAKIVIHQAEDEIGAINMAIGASFAGALSMTASSGGGFALMSESISLAGMVETPLVIALVSRPGPATGLPTWTAQEDLNLAVNAGQGEFAKIILSPSDPHQAYILTHEAFKLSQDYQVPVIILSDKYLGESYFSQDQFENLEPIPLNNLTQPKKNSEKTFFTRYAYTPSGIHPRTLPGMEYGEYVAESKEHQATGIATESPQEREMQVKRRLHKMQAIKNEVPLPEIIGKGRNALITWGSNKYIGAQVSQGLKNYAQIHFTRLWPLPNNLAKILKNYNNLTTLENNATGQLARLLTAEASLPVNSITSFLGRPIDPEEVINNINNAKQS